MRLIDNLDDIQQPLTRAVVTMGNFDGVHIGHQALFHAVIEKADEIGGTSVAVTFEPHPIRALKQNGHPPLITLFEQKSELIAVSGIEVLVCIPFTPEFATLPARTFLEEILVGRIGMRAIVVGRDNTFGRDREGNLALLEELAGPLGYEVITTDWIRSNNGAPSRISSTRVRELVMAGEMDKARSLLGRHYQIRGRVVSGRDRGAKLLNCPTANIHLQDELCPKTGIYAVTVECRGRRYGGVANIGYSPTFDDRQFTVEVHLLDMEADLYGETIRVNFLQRIRDEKRFADIDQLAAQIRDDVRVAREIIAR